MRKCFKVVKQSHFSMALWCDLLCCGGNSSISNWPKLLYDRVVGESFGGIFTLYLCASCWRVFLLSLHLSSQSSLSNEVLWLRKHSLSFSRWLTALCPYKRCLWSLTFLLHSIWHTACNVPSDLRRNNNGQGISGMSRREIVIYEATSIELNWVFGMARSIPHWACTFQSWIVAHKMQPI